MKWTEEHETLMLRELMLVQPWQHRKGSVERGEDLENLAKSLNNIKEPKFRVSQRSVRDHYILLEKRFRRKNREEERASGISPEESELDELLQEIVEMFDESDKVVEEKKKKAEEETTKIEEMRKRSLETFKESAKRSTEESQQALGNAPDKRRRASGSDTMSYLKQKAESDERLKREKVDVKKKELDLHIKEQEERQQQFELMNRQARDMQAMQQQQMQQMLQLNSTMMQQQQQQTQALLEIVRKLAEK